MSWESWVSRWSRLLAVAGIVAVVAVFPLGGIPAGAAPPSGSDGSISGVVVDAGTGLPLAGICVNVENGPGAQTDSTGAYSITGLSDGAYKVQFHDCNPSPQYLDQWYLGHDDSSSADMVPVTAGADTPLSDVQLVMGVSVAGTVTDGSGTPVGGVQVNVNPMNPGQSTGVQTQPDGTYRTSPLPPGDYKVQFGDSNTPALAHEFWNGKPSWNTGDTLTLTAADAPVHGGVDAQLPAAASDPRDRDGSRREPARRRLRERERAEQRRMGLGRVDARPSPTARTRLTQLPPGASPSSSTTATGTAPTSTSGTTTRHRSTRRTRSCSPRGRFAQASTRSSPAASRCRGRSPTPTATRSRGST